MKRNKINKRVPTYKFGLDQAGSLAGILGTTLNATGNDTAGAIGGALSGAASSAALGPIGMAGGAILGGVTSLFGSSARKKAEEAAKRRAQQQQIMNAAVSNTASIQEEYGQENPLAYTFANGGVMPGGLAYVDDGEVIQYPNGITAEVPEQGQSTDQNLTMLPEASTILSDSIKLKELGGKTPAQYYKEKSSKIKYGTDEYGKNSAKLNKQNNDKLYNNLLMLQTQDNINNSRKTGSKIIPAYDIGKDYDNTGGRVTERGERLYENGKTRYDYSLRRRWDPGFIDLPGENESLEKLMKDPDLMKVTDKDPSAIHRWSTAYNKAHYDIVDSKPITPMNANPVKYNKILRTDYKNQDKKDNKSSFWNFNPNSISSLAPVVYNFAQSLRQPELEEPIQNPYASNITSSLARRRYNINPALQANARARAISNYNLSLIAPNTGASMAQRVQSALGQYNANVDLYGVQQNANNQYIADYANTLNSLGQQNVQAQNIAAQQNRIARAKREEFAGAAATQFSKWAQTQQQMTNQMRNDAAVLPALQKFLSQGYTTEELANIISNLPNFK